MEDKKRISDGLNQAADAAKAAADKAKKGAQAAADKAAAAARSAQESVKEELEEIQDFTPPRTKRINTAWMWILLVIICSLVIVWIMPEQCTREDVREKDHTVAAAFEAAEDSVDARMTAAGAEAGAAPVDPAASAALAAEDPAPAVASAASSAVAAESASAKSDVATADVDELARRVLRGEFGDNPDRRAALGDRYAAVQTRVNALLK